MRVFLKSAAYWVATALVFPALASFWVRARLMGGDRALAGSSQLIGLVPGVLGQYLRRAFYTRVLAHCDRTATIEFGTLFSARGARIEENVYIGPRCHIGLAHVGRETLIGPAVHIPSGGATHGTDLDRPLREQDGRPMMVHVGEACWIGSAAVVMADVGRQTIVGAGAVVTRPIPARVVAGGVPARVIRPRG